MIKELERDDLSEKDEVYLGVPIGHQLKEKLKKVPVEGNIYGVLDF